MVVVINYLHKVFDIVSRNSRLHPQLEFLQSDAAIFVFVYFIK